jgi:hypothetical protein
VQRSEEYKNTTIEAVARPRPKGLFYARFKIIRTVHGVAEFVMQNDDFGSFSTPEKALDYCFSKARLQIDEDVLPWTRVPDSAV